MFLDHLFFIFAMDQKQNTMLYSIDFYLLCILELTKVKVRKI